MKTNHVSVLLSVVFLRGNVGKIITFIAGIVFLLICNNSHAAPIYTNAHATTYNFYGNIDILEEYSSSIPFGISQGSDFIYTAKLQVNSKPVIDSSSYSLFYLFSSSLKIGDIYYDEISNKSVGVYNDYSSYPYDKIEFDQGGQLSEASGGEGRYLANIAFWDYNETILTSTKIPNFIDQLDFNFYLLAYGTDDSGGDKYYLRGTVNTVEVIKNPVPEPSTFLLLGCGLASLAFYARRRRKE